MGYPESSASPNSDETISLDKYPGKVCFLCNLGERSILGQGDFLRIQIFGNINEFDEEAGTVVDELLNEEPKSNKETLQQPFRRSKNSSKSKYANDVHELDNVGHAEIVNLQKQCDGSFLYVHQSCAMWTLRTNSITSETLQKVGAQCLPRKCFYCDQYGASITCSFDCKKVFHLPCASASGCFLVIKTFTSFCSEHLNQVPYHCTENNVCRICAVFGDISKLIMCSTCGEHYHTTCVGLVNSPDTRCGWNCLHCSKCQICRQSDSSEGRSVKCEQCQKQYHTTCLRPMISTVPKYGWKCNHCRVCSDCGSRTPGGGTSSRWHCHYTICDSCYQQRNKGFSCPICHKAYRAAAHKEMVKCSACNRFVHSTCDKEADLNIYHKRKEHNPDYDYICPHCKNKHYGEFSSNELTYTTDATMSTDSFGERLSKGGGDIEGSSEKSYQDSGFIEDKSFETLKNSKRRLNFKEIQRGRGGKLAFQKNYMFSQLNRKRGTRGRNRILNNGLERILDKNKNRGAEEDISMEKKILFCSTNDMFTLSGDICIMCGSVGIDQEDTLIACVQCGQCYHTYCANVKISKVMLKKGWRCLDCTVCEGCGQKDDEGRLILCDECDISYHIYCMNPPLEIVPHGNWKCKLCAVCEKCGRSSPGKHANSFDELMYCSPCASLTKCSICTRQYMENELIIQCNSCERWLHCQCDPLYIKNDTQLFENNEYHCIFCKPNEQNSPQIKVESSNSSSNHYMSDIKNSAHYSTFGRKQNLESNYTHYSQSESNDCTDSGHLMDGIYVSERGLHSIKSLSADIKRKRKVRPCNELPVKDEGVEAAIESVVSATNVISVEEVKDCDNTENGLIGLGSTNSPPQTIRKKRQRNLQKLGIGGFLAKNRIYKKDLEGVNLPDAIQNNQALSAEKKKKLMRKKSKEKLTDIYPSYLQEAFFGKTLLDAKEGTKWESDSSEDLSSNISKNIVNENNLNKQNNSGPTNIITTTTEQVEQIVNSNLYTINMQQNTMAPAIKSTSKINSDIPITPEICSNNVKRNGSYDVQNFNPKLAVEEKTLLNDIAAGISIINADCLNTSTVVLENQAITSNLKDPIERKKVEFSVHQNRIEDTILTGQIIQPNDMNKSTFALQTQNINNTQNTYKLQIQTVGQKVNQNGEVLVKRTTAEGNTESVAVGTQKTAEKMRRDEDLGEMATISAVLYANTQFPDLKQVYPNWTDRCKQILKKWRSLSTEKKAPFLQHAKDNRSALRQQRIQQFQGKSFLPQKTSKTNEVDVKKQTQLKPNDIVSDYNNIVEDPLNKGIQMHSLSDRQIVINNEPTNTESVTDQKTIAFVQNNFQIKRTTFPVEKKKDFDNISNSNNKHLRNLLQTQATYSVPPTNLLSTHPRPISNIITKSTGVQPNVFIHQDNFRPNLNIQSKYEIKAVENSESNNTAELEKIDQDENVGFGDILGGLGEGDDDDLLKSLTTEIGDDFNILEYADPELDELSTNQNILNKLDLDDSEKTSINS